MAASASVKKVSWWHERLADWMIAHPDRTLGEAAKYFNVTPTWLSVIKNSDAFRDYWASRSAEASSYMLADIKDKTLLVTEMALDRLIDRVNTTGDVMPPDLLLDVAKTGLKSLGYGVTPAAPAAGSNVNIQLNVTPGALETARQKMQATFGVQPDGHADQKLLAFKSSEERPEGAS